MHPYIRDLCWVHLILEPAGLSELLHSSQLGIGNTEIAVRVWLPLHGLSQGFLYDHLTPASGTHQWRLGIGNTEIAARVWLALHGLRQGFLYVPLTPVSGAGHRQSQGFLYVPLSPFGLLEGLQDGVEASCTFLSRPSRSFCYLFLLAYSVH